MYILPTYLLCYIGRYLPTYLVWPTYINIDSNFFWTNSIDMAHGKILLHHVSQSKNI
jgi:hypothetical protein